MSKIVYTGKESCGKSLKLSAKAEEIRQRNARWFKITHFQRTMAFNTPMSLEFIDSITRVGCRYLYFKNLDEIVFLEEADIFIDELIKYFPANGSVALSREQLHFLTQGAKSGVHLFGASQDFANCHKDLRRLVQRVYVITKIIGSKRPMKSSPEVKRIWGMGVIREVAPESFKGDSATMKGNSMPMPFFIYKVDCDRYDTSFKVPLSKLPVKRLRKQIEWCEEDDFRRVKYV